MIVTATQQDDAAERHYEFCIVGAGPAGITLALELAGRRRHVCVLEAGGESYSAAAQQLLDGAVSGGRYPPLRSTRMSVLGGSSQVWAGWCRPLDAEDFKPRPQLGTPGWPFDGDMLLPYYRRAHEHCGLTEFDYDADTWRERLAQEPLPVHADELVHCMFHVRAQQFGIAHRTRLEDETTLDVLLHASVTALDIDERGAVRAAHARTASGQRVVIRAQQYILAAGGIENAKLLLLSAPEPDRAPGNAHGLVGRFFTDHPFINPGWLVLSGGPRRLDFYFPQPVAAGAAARVRATLSLPRTVIEREELPASAMFFHPRYEAHAVFDEPAVRAFLELRDTLRSRAVPGAPKPLLSRALRGPHHIAVAALRKLLVRDGPAARWRLRMMFETAARLENRVELDHRIDAQGRPGTRLHWQVSDTELDGMRRSLRLFDAAFRRCGLGHVEISLPDDRAAWRAALEGGKHHMGTTRMHADPRQGVVDATCRVHGTRNLYIAGSSIFPSGGFANPTLTIVALAIRLADHLADTTRAGSTTH
jgi:choline dehydrogenase-like flavoprotein